jgi:uncharacterized Fe-S radical SAM superfamily protein PflX
MADDRADTFEPAYRSLNRRGELFERARVASYGAHHGEERPLSGMDGSGTVFFSWCSLRCESCQDCHAVSRSTLHVADRQATT